MTRRYKHRSIHETPEQLAIRKERYVELAQAYLALRIINREGSRGNSLAQAQEYVLELARA